MRRRPVWQHQRRRRPRNNQLARNKIWRVANQAARHFRFKSMLNTILLVFSFVCFVLAVFPIPARFNLVALGLACWMLTMVLQAFSHTR